MSPRKSRDDRTKDSTLAARAAAGRLVIRRPALLLAALLALTLPLASRAEGFVYWPNAGDFFGSHPSALSIGRANPDGTAVNQRFVILPGVRGTVEGASGVAVDASHVYWVSALGGIGRANLDGTGASQNVVRVGDFPCDLAVDGAHIYWTDEVTDAGTIGRANLDGTGVNRSFIRGASRCGRVAVDDAHVYWTSLHEGTRTIARANLDGTGVNHGFLRPPGGVCGLAVDASHLYWASGSDGIGRANLDGTGADQGFISAGGDYPCDLAVDGGHIYWVNYLGETDSTIGRANLDGSGVDQGFIPDPGDFLTDVAVDGLRSFSLGKVRQDKRKGTARLTVRVPTPGDLKLAKTKGVRGRDKRAEAAGKVKLAIKPTRKALKELDKKGKAKVKAKITYTPDGGDPNIVASTLTQPLKLVKRVKQQ